MTKPVLVPGKDQVFLPYHGGRRTAGRTCQTGTAEIRKPAMQFSEIRLTQYPYTCFLDRQSATDKLVIYLQESVSIIILKK